MWLSQSLEDQKIWSDTTNYAGCIIHKPSGLVVACCQVIPVKVLPLKRWLIRHPNLLKYEREYSKILVTYFVASDEIASFKPTSKCRFWRWIHVTFLDDISHHTASHYFPGERNACIAISVITVVFSLEQVWLVEVGKVWKYSENNSSWV